MPDPSTLGMWLPALALMLQPEGSLGDLTLQLLWLPRLHLKEPSYSLPLSWTWPEQKRQPLPPRVWFPTPAPRLPSLGIHTAGVRLSLPLNLTILSDLTFTPKFFVLKSGPSPLFFKPSYCASQQSLGLTIPLPQPLQRWHYKHAPYSAFLYLLLKRHRQRICDSHTLNTGHSPCS